MIDWVRIQPELEKKLNPAHVRQRSQAGQRLSYIEGWHAIAEANRIFGFGAWHSETVDMRCVVERERQIGKPPDTRDGWSVTYTAKVRIVAGDVVREGSGAGHGVATDLGECHESALKEAETDALKRALMKFGNPFGLALYDKSRVNVGVDAEPPDPDAIEAAIGSFEDAETLDALKAIWTGLPKPIQAVPAVIKAKDAAKARIETPPSQSQSDNADLGGDHISYQ